ncbi:protein FAR1-RELATED SEQUENCE 5-like [Humulus lupulus]|uniref:protein FAR1-RELATED SEQUENCE 5-like n=1 Tax=Humulus lupulus TaxID=3486 RepID=UPI002B40D475|nr:protein FAR1-RELATED SEQUENCE 5-like [Humulus lupulus]
MTSYENGLEAEQEVTKSLSSEHEVDPAGGTRLEETNDEDVPEDNVECGIIEEWTKPDIAQWRSLLQFLDIDKEPEHIQFSDFEGKEFVLENTKYYNLDNRCKEARALTRTGCNAEFRINLNRETNHWITKCFNNHHNHKFAFFRERPFLRSDRIFRDEMREQVMSMKRAGIKTSQIWNYMVEVHDGWENVGCIKDDLYKGICKKYSTWDDCDTSTAMGYLEAKKGPDNMFFYKYDVDKENRLKNLFWSDGTSQVDYQLFGDCLAFDSTYKTNRYGKPLVILLGSNNHDKTCVFGAALLDNETSTTYDWVLETFLECMGGKMPSAVLTDGCKAMNKALDNIMPGVPHRICSWHILKNAMHHVHNIAFHQELKKFIFRYYKEEEWEDNWKVTVKKYRLTGNAWVEAQYGTRKQWADTFLRGIYFGGATATGRCESMNAFLKRDLQNKIPLWMFIRHFDHALSMLRYNEMKEHYKTNLTESILNQTTIPCVEDEISSIFTREIFTRIRKEIQRGDNYIVLKDDKIPGYTLCLVKKYIGFGLKRKVLISNDGDDVRCDCYSLETKGIPCRHIFISLKNLERRSLPICLVNRRWLKDAKEVQLLTQGTERKCPHPEVIENSRYGGVTTQTTITSNLATRSREAFQKAMKVISELNAELEKMPPDEELKHPQNDEGVFPNNILDSQIKKTKGRPTTASLSKSFSGGAKKRKPKKSLLHCKYCGEVGHDSRNCPMQPKSTTKKNGHSKNKKKKINP